jgi:ribosomal protein S21
MKNNNWQKNTKESYNHQEKDFVKYPEQPKRVLSGKTISVWKDDVNGALRKLKRILENDGRQKDLARHEFYEKPSVKRKRAKSVAKNRWARDVDKMRESGTWVDGNSSDPSCFKSKRRRRAHVTLQDKIKNRKRG